jgi:glycosyltransferase involved in cell wall biosynthesis
LKRIIVSVTNDLITDQRVARICDTLSEMNFDILLIGRKHQNNIPLKRNYKTKRIKLVFNKGFLFYAEYNLRLFFILLFSKKDLLLSNDLDTLLANFLVSRIQSKKLTFDSHELFSEVPELIDKPFVKKVWNALESFILPKLKNNYTVCTSIANYYNTKYNTHFKVIRNVPKEHTLERGRFSFDTHDKKIILYQGSVNMGRGLELMIDTMEFLHNHIFVIIGSGDIIADLKQKTTTKDLDSKVKFIDKTPPLELQKLTPLADLGISFEEDLGLNYRYALPNKIFDYIQAEVPVLVSDLPEMKQIVFDYNVGEIIENRNSEIIAKQIETLLQKNYSSSLQKAKKELTWTNEKKKLIALFSAIK